MRLQSQATIILVLVILVPFTYSGDAFNESADTSFRSSEIYDSQELLPDPKLTIEPDYAIQGLSEEFSFDYESPSTDRDEGTVTLNWSHTPGTRLVFDTSGVLPTCQDFVYFSQEFTWALNNLPSSLNLSLRYQISKTGSFEPQYASALFELKFWFIHPDGIWQYITSFGGNQDPHTTNSHTISRIYFDELFDKIMAGSDQESPTAATLAIGLVPTWRFHDDNGLQLWREYNGSVIVDVTEIGLSALHTRSDIRIESEITAFNNSWQVNRLDSFRDSFMASDDTLYVLAMEEVEGIGTASILTRVGFRGNEIWRKTWNAADGMLAHSVAATPYRVYVLGTLYGSGVSSDVFIYALDVNGNPLWNKTLDFSASDYPGDIGINSEGDIFVGISTVLSPERNVLIKLNDTGNILWEEYFGATQWDRVQDVEVCKDGNVYTRTEDHLCLWDENGERLWSRTGRFNDAYALENGNVLTTSPTSYRTIRLTCYSLAGEQQWYSTFNIRYAQDWWDFVTISSAIDGPDGTIFVLLWTYGYHPGRILLQLDGSGTQMLNRTLSFSEELYDIYDIPQYYDMYTDSNGLLYLVGEYVDHNWDYSLMVGVYDFVGAVTSMNNTLIINSSIALMLVMGVIFGFELKRKIPS